MHHKICPLVPAGISFVFMGYLLNDISNHPTHIIENKKIRNTLNIGSSVFQTTGCGVLSLWSLVVITKYIYKTN